VPRRGTFELLHGYLGPVGGASWCSRGNCVYSHAPPSDRRGPVVHVELNCPVHVLWSRGGTGCLCAVLFRWEPGLCCDLGGGLGISVFLVGVLMQLSAGKKFMFSPPLSCLCVPGHFALLEQELSARPTHTPF
jgi:hypothetical protein